MERTQRHQRDTEREASLVYRAQHGERDAFENLTDRYRDAIRAHARRILRDAEDAEDATQETFVKALRAIGSFDPGRPLLPWLMRICTNCCMDALRDRRRGPASLDRHEYSLCDETLDVEAGVEAREESETVQQAITRLPDRYREIIVMRHYRHMEVNEIADALRRPEGTIKSWLFRARALLRKDLTVALSA